VTKQWAPPKKPHRQWTTEIRQEILSHILDGVGIEEAGRIAGVTKSVFADWRAWGKRGIEPYAQFYEAIDVTVHQEEAWHVKNLRKHAGEDWRASTWWLARKYPKKYSEKHLIAEAAKEAVEEGRVRLSIPVLREYLAKLGYDLVPLKSGAEEANDAEDQSED